MPRPRQRGHWLIAIGSGGWSEVHGLILRRTVKEKQGAVLPAARRGRENSLNALFPLQTLVVSIIRLHTMAKALSKSQIASSLAETVGLTKKQAVQTLEALVTLAYKNAKNSFTIPGLGKIVLVNRKARMGRNPATGETIKIAAKRVVKFRVAKAAKDAILGVKK
jgi:DNA-binding protein HU-beta